MSRLLSYRPSPLLGAVALTFGLAGAPALAFDPAAMSDEERAAFGTAVRDYLMENPEVLVEAINVLEERRMQDAAQNDALMIGNNAAAIFEDEGDYIGGNPEGDLTVVEFVDFRCGVCRQVAEQVLDEVAKDGNIRLVIKDFPILGQESDLTARFAVAVRQAHGNEAYLKAHDALFALRGPATLEALTRIAEAEGWEAETLLNAMNSDEVNDYLRRTGQLAQTLGIAGTPSFIIGEQLLRGMPRAGLGSVIEAERAAE